MGSPATFPFDPRRGASARRDDGSARPRRGPAGFGPGPRVAKLIRVVYVSDASGDLTPDELREIAMVSARNNAADQLTGVLLHTPDTFLQVLEGEEQVLLATLARIDKDPRHTDLRVLLDQVIAERAFGEWAMGGYEIATEALPEALTKTPSLPPEVLAFEGAAKLSSRIAQAPPSAVLDFLTRFYMIQTRAWPLV